LAGLSWQSLGGTIEINRPVANHQYMRKPNNMNWKLFWICGIFYLLMLATGFWGFPRLSSLLFWIFLALVVINFIVTACYVYRKNRPFLNKKE
jgi:uncharacterized membrane protein YfcA